MEENNLNNLSDGNQTMENQQPVMPVAEPTPAVVPVGNPTPVENMPTEKPPIMPVVEPTPPVAPVGNPTPVEDTPTGQPPVPPIVGPPDQPSMQEPPAKKSINKINLIIGGLILVFLIAGIGLFFYKTNTKNIIFGSMKSFKESIAAASDKINTRELGDDFTIKGKAVYQGDFKCFSEDLSVCSVFKNLIGTNFDYVYAQDRTNKKIELDTAASLNGEEIISAKYHNYDSKQYLFLGKIFDKWIQYEDYDIFEVLDKGNTEDNEYIYNVILKSINKNLSKDSLKKEDATIKIDGKDTKVTKASLSLNNNQVNELIKTVISDIKKDKKANDLLVKNFPEFGNNTYDVSSILGANTTISYNVYVAGLSAEIKKYEIEIKDSTSVSTTSYTKGKTNVFEITEDGKSFLAFDITSTKDETTIKMKELGRPVGDIKIVIKDDYISMKLNYDYYDKPTTINFESRQKEIKKNEKYESTYAFSINLVDQLKIELKGTETASKGANIKENVSNAIPNTSITDEELITMVNALSNIMMKLFQ